MSTIVYHLPVFLVTFENYLYCILLLYSGACNIKSPHFLSIPDQHGPPPQTLAVNSAPTRTQPLNPHNERCAPMGGTATVKDLFILFNKIEVTPGAHCSGRGRGRHSHRRH